MPTWIMSLIVIAAGLLALVNKSDNRWNKPIKVFLGISIVVQSIVAYSEKTTAAAEKVTAAADKRSLTEQLASLSTDNKSLSAQNKQLSDKADSLLKDNNELRTRLSPKLVLLDDRTVRTQDATTHKFKTVYQFRPRNNVSIQDAKLEMLFDSPVEHLRATFRNLNAVVSLQDVSDQDFSENTNVITLGKEHIDGNCRVDIEVTSLKPITILKYVVSP